MKRFTLYLAAVATVIGLSACQSPVAEQQPMRLAYNGELPDLDARS
jgi:hypothetical protein